ncbi:unnamed protein product [Adineta ricciae]|uniref:Uncharacterized protein n=1 Tax=Adineta ricciae TaxID=249248 RepID=A0A814W969_ADIRI|nr:unnamed protein product [Adineta ricciae]CAF1201999.1 unnamed protein product [Adineta ricciae]
MFFYRGKPLTSRASSETSFSSDNSFLSNRNATSAGILRQLSVNELDEINSTGFNQEYPVQRELFDTSRPLFTIPRPTIYLPMNNSERSRRFSRTSTPSTITHSSERAFYQNLPPPPPPLPSLPSLSTQYPIDSQLLFPPRAQRYVPLPMNYPIKKRKKSAREKPPGLFTTLFAGGLSTLAALIYLIVSLALPAAKLTFGILYLNECPVNKNIPLYMITAGACGLTIVILIVLSSACTLCRTMSDARRSIHGFMICTIALVRGMQGVLTIFLIIWFFFGNFWVFSVRYRVQTERPNDANNYCHPTLYWFAYWILIFTYIYAVFTYCLKFCINFFCCGAFDSWYRAFS